VTEQAEGPGTVETYTVRRDGGRPTGIVIGRLDANGSRFLATTEDDELIGLLTDGDPLGRSVVVRSLHYGNRCALG
jgi:acetyl-CoA C-acetyltransferase